MAEEDGVSPGARSGIERKMGPSRSVLVSRVVAAMAVSLAAGTCMGLSPGLALLVGPFAIALVDEQVARLSPVPRPVVSSRLVARAVLAATWGGALYAVVRLSHLEPPEKLARWAPWAVTLLGIVVAIATIASAIYGGLGTPPKGKQIVFAWRTRMIDAPFVALLDAVLLVAAARASFGARAPLADRLSVAASIAAMLLARSIMVAAFGLGLAGSFRDKGRGVGYFAMLTFVGWVGAASLAATLADNRIAWSGVGAAIALTFASVLAELRSGRRNPVAALARAAFAWSVAAFVGLLAIAIPVNG